MAVAMAHRPPLRRPGTALLGAVIGFGVATIVFGISENPYLSFVALLLTGALDNISVVVRGTLMQVLTPDEMRGRVAAVNAIFISCSNELGAFESGITAYWFGPVISVVGGGIGTLIVVVLALTRWPELIRLGPLHLLRTEVLTPAAPTGAGHEPMETPEPEVGIKADPP
jgi:MFS family permease